jgi:protein involved in polysaccharide export with SLBB domain
MADWRGVKRRLRELLKCVKNQNKPSGLSKYSKLLACWLGASQRITRASRATVIEETGIVRIKSVISVVLSLLTALEPTMALAQPAPSPAAPAPVPPTEPAPTTLTPEGRAVLEGPVDASSYIVGPGDRLLVELWGLREQSSEIEVTAEGRLFVPRVGVFAAGGEKLATLRNSITVRLKDAFPNLHANVTLLRPRTFLVNVVGAVSRPGPYLASALTRVSALVPRALPLPNASTRRVEIRRRGRAEKGKIIADLTAFTTFGDPSRDPTVLDGDTVYVPLRELDVEVTGAVKRPGHYELVGEGNIRELLELAGGLSNTAAVTLPIRLTSRESGDRLIVRSLPMASAPETVLHPGDTVHISGFADLSRTVVVEGAIVGTGQAVSSAPVGERPPDALGTPNRDISVAMPFVEGDGVSDLVVKAGGLQAWADGQSAYLLRPVTSGQRKRIPVDVLAINSRQVADVAIQPGDTLVIPSRRDAVVVGGAVQHPGLFPYSRNLHPPDYLTLAGGPTRTGQAGSAVVLRRSGESKKIEDVTEIEPGDVISVPEAALSTAEWINIVLIAANLILTATFVVLTVRYYHP